MRGEAEQTQRAGRKRGLWGSIGSTLLGGLATVLTAGAATPAVMAALASGGASFVGGHLGNWLAGTTKGGDLSGGRYYKEERADLGKQIKEGINVGALKAGMQAGFMKALKGATKGKAAPSDPKLGAKMPAYGAKSVADPIGVQALKAPKVSPIGIQMPSSVSSGKSLLDVAIDPKDIRGMSSWEAFKSSEAVLEKIPELTPQYKTPGVKGFMQRLLPGGETGRQTAIPPGKGLSAIEQSWQSAVESGDYQTPVHPLSYPDVGTAGPPKLTTGWEGRGQKLLPQRGKFGEIESIIGDRATSISGIREELITEGEASLGVGARDRGFMPSEDIKSIIDKASGQEKWRNLPEEFQVIDPLQGMQDQIKNIPQGSPSFKQGNLPVNYPSEKTLSNIEFRQFDEQIPWQNRFFPNEKYSNLLRKPGGFDPRW